MLSSVVSGVPNSNTKLLRIIDAENNYEYQISVTDDEYSRAQNDIAFATRLLEENRQEETQTSPIENTPTVESSTQVIWTDSSTKLFLSLYKELTDAKDNILKKNLFEKLASEMKKHSYELTAKQCSTKMDSLKRTYKSIKDHNSKTGNSRKSWIYFEAMDEIFGGKEWAAPLSTIASTSRSGDKAAEESLQTPKTTRKRGKADDTLRSLIKVKKKQHEEKMMRLDKMNSLLETLVSNAILKH